jgi:hypothetical protein
MFQWLETMIDFWRYIFNLKRNIKSKCKDALEWWENKGLVGGVIYFKIDQLYRVLPMESEKFYKKSVRIIRNAAEVVYWHGSTNLTGNISI